MEETKPDKLRVELYSLMRSEMEKYKTPIIDTRATEEMMLHICVRCYEKGFAAGRAAATLLETKESVL